MAEQQQQLEIEMDDMNQHQDQEQEQPEGQQRNWIQRRWDDVSGYAKRKWSVSQGNEDAEMSQLEEANGGEMTGGAANTSDVYRYLSASIRKLGKNDVRGIRSELLGKIEGLVKALETPLPAVMSEHFSIDTIPLEQAYQDLIQQCNVYFRKLGTLSRKQGSLLSERNLVWQVYSRASQESAVVLSCYKLAAMTTRQKKTKLSAYKWNDIYPLAREFVTTIKAETEQKQQGLASDLRKQLRELDLKVLRSGAEDASTVVDIGRDLYNALNASIPKTENDFTTGLTNLKKLRDDFVVAANTFRTSHSADALDPADKDFHKKQEAVAMSPYLLFTTSMLEEQLLEMEQNANNGFSILKEEDRLNEKHDWEEVCLGKIVKTKAGRSDDNSVYYDTVAEYKEKTPWQEYKNAVKGQVDEKVAENVEKAADDLFKKLDEDIKFDAEYLAKMKEVEAAYKKCKEENGRYLDNHGKQGRVEIETTFRKYVQGFQDLITKQSENLRHKAVEFRNTKTTEQALQNQHQEGEVQPKVYKWHEVFRDVKAKEPEKPLPLDTIKVNDEDFEGIVFEDATDLPIFKEPITPKAVSQGGTFDCYLISTLIGLAEKDISFVFNMIKDNKDGTATVRLYDKQNNPVLITVKKSLPAGKDRSKVSKNGDNSLWAYLIEKAATRLLQAVQTDDPNRTRPEQVNDAKAQRGNLTFSALNYGTPEMAAQILTGKEAQKLGLLEAITSKTTEDEKKAASWETMIQALKDKKVVTCSTNAATVPGIDTSHFYYVVQPGGAQPDGEASVLMQNPRGGGDEIPKYFYDENNALKETKPEVSETGTFVMRKTDFLNTFKAEDVFILDTTGLNHVPIGEKAPAPGEQAPQQMVPKLNTASFHKTQNEVGKIKGTQVTDKSGRLQKDTYSDRTLYPLFGPTLNPREVIQGTVKDSALISVLIGLAEKSPGMITNMIRDNEDGTVTVRLFEDVMKPRYVTVQKSVPAGESGKKWSKGGLWASLIEKAVHSQWNVESLDLANATIYLTGKRPVTPYGMALQKLGNDSERPDDDQQWAVVLEALEKGSLVTALTGGVKTTLPGLVPNQYYYVMKKAPGPVEGEEAVILYNTKGPGSVGIVYDEQKRLGARAGKTEDGTFPVKKSDFIKGLLPMILDKDKMTPTAFDENSDLAAPPTIIHLGDEGGAVQKRQEEPEEPTEMPAMLVNGETFTKKLHYFRRRINDNPPNIQEGNSPQMASFLESLDMLISALEAPLPNMKNSGLTDEEAEKKILETAKGYFQHLFISLGNLATQYLSDHGKASLSIPGITRQHCVEGVLDYVHRFGPLFYEAAVQKTAELKATNELNKDHTYAEFLAFGHLKFSEPYKKTLVLGKTAPEAPTDFTANGLIMRYKDFIHDFTSRITLLEGNDDSTPLINDETPSVMNMLKELGVLSTELSSIMPQRKLAAKTELIDEKLNLEFATKKTKVIDSYKKALEQIDECLRIQDLIIIKEGANKPGAQSYIAGLMQRQQDVLKMRRRVQHEYDLVREDKKDLLQKAWTKLDQANRLHEVHTVAQFLCMTDALPENEPVPPLPEHPRVSAASGREYLGYYTAYSHLIKSLNETPDASESSRMLYQKMYEYIEYLRMPFNKASAGNVLKFQSKQIVTHLNYIRHWANLVQQVESHKKRKKGAETSALTSATNDILKMVADDLPYAPRVAEHAAKLANREDTPVTINTLADVMANRVDPEVKGLHESQREKEQIMVNEINQYYLFVDGVSTIENNAFTTVFRRIKNGMKLLLNLMNGKFTNESIDNDFLKVLIPLDEDLTAYKGFAERKAGEKSRMDLLHRYIKILLNKAALRPSGKLLAQLKADGAQYQEHKANYGLVMAKDLIYMTGTDEGNRDLFGGLNEGDTAQTNQAEAKKTVDALQRGANSFASFNPDENADATKNFGEITSEEDKRLAYDLQILDELDYDGLGPQAAKRQKELSKAGLYRLKKGTLEAGPDGDAEKKQREVIAMDLKPTVGRIVNKVIQQTGQLDALTLSNDSDYVKKENAEKILQIYQFYDRVTSLDSALTEKLQKSIFDSSFLPEDKRDEFLAVWKYYKAKIQYCFDRLRMIADEKYAEYGAVKTATLGTADNPLDLDDEGEANLTSISLNVQKSARALLIEELRRKLKAGLL